MVLTRRGRTRAAAPPPATPPPEPAPERPSSPNLAGQMATMMAMITALSSAVSGLQNDALEREVRQEADSLRSSPQEVTPKHARKMAKRARSSPPPRSATDDDSDTETRDFSHRRPQSFKLKDRFHGTTEDNVSHFLDLFELQATIAGLTDDDRMLQLPTCLKDRALRQGFNARYTLCKSWLLPWLGPVSNSP